MNYRQAALVAMMITSSSNAALAGAPQLRDGLYEVQFRLELPHLETHAVDRTTTICIDQAGPERQRPPIPLLSQKQIFAGCRIDNVRRGAAGFSYDITCTGRGSARASATYVTSPGRFKSRIAIIQGAKNMTMMEVQRGRRLGDCRAAHP